MRFVKKHSPPKGNSQTPEPINWEKIEMRVYALKNPRIAPEEKLRIAKLLAEIFRYHNRPLPNELAILV